MPSKSLCIAMFGSSGFIGTALSNHLASAGHTLRRFVRVSPTFIEGQDKISWDPYEGNLPERYLEHCNAAINLCGKDIAGGRWTDDYKRQITDSRVIPTTLIAQKLAGMPNPPRLLLNASAVGYYGNHNISRLLTESSDPGEGFLADMCKEWEEATSIADWAGIRIVNLRFGIVIGRNGGFMARLLPLFRMNLGSRLGHGQQPMSWVAMPDLLRAVEYLLHSPAINKGVNITSPKPVTNEEFTRELAGVLGKKTFLPAPAFALKMAYGEMANEALLGGQAVVPKKLIDAGFEFRYADLRSALEYATA